MSEYKPTPAQQAVIDNEGGALLVSAAAGSGKTSVLIQRLLRKLTDENHPKNIDDFLIITYTKAAAAELRSKIAHAISKELSKQPNNRHLARQLHRLSLAKISTVHSFCAALLRDYAHELELPADFRVAEDRESKAMQQKALADTLEQIYTQIGSDPALQSFIETLGFGRDDRRAGKIIIKLYNGMLTHADPEQWMRESVSAIAPEDGVIPQWERVLIESSRKKINRLGGHVKALADQCMAYPPFDTCYAPVLLTDAEKYAALAECSSWEEFRAAGGITLDKLQSAPKGSDPVFRKRIQEKRKSLKAKADRLMIPFAMERAKAYEETGKTSLALTGAFAVVQRFRETYDSEKRRRHLLDYSDLEHEALRLLVQKGTTLPTRIAREISARFTEIMVDEYQDTNEIQDQIFSAVSQDGKNLFMVGDVKQSIYRFRMADPTIFLRKYHAYTQSENAADGEPRKILLSANFRSKPEILDAVNCVFSAVMSEQVGELDYGAAEALYDERHQPRSETPLVELHCIDTTQDNDTDETADKAEYEAEWIAGRICELIDSGEAEPKDITILLRSTKHAMHYYLNALERHGIPTESLGGSILNSVEIEALICLLQTIDNPHQDIPLIGAMTSPIFGFRFDDLAKLHAAHRWQDLYDALYRAAREDERLKQFIDTLTELQAEQRLCRLSELLQLLETKLQLRNVFASMENGALRVRNLNLFYQLAAGFEADEPKTLHQFLTYLDELEEQEISPTSEGGNAVKVTSIHSSKGLEYPVVFLAGLSKEFNLQSLSESVLSHPELGAACEVADRDNNIRYNSCAKLAISERLKQDMASEELRILYVAMTRPQNRLIMTYCANKLSKELQRVGNHLNILPVKQAAEEAKGIGDWVLLTAMGRMEGACLSQYGEVEVEKTVSEIPWHIEIHKAPALSGEKKNPEEERPVQRLPELPEDLAQTLSFAYPYAAATVLPEKITATRLKGRSVDSESAEAAEELLPVKHYSFPRPQFAEQTKGLTGAERGTATHLAMQFIRYENCGSIEGIREELERLKRERFITDIQADAVEPERLWAFFSSELGQWVRSAEKVMREFKFSVFMDAKVLDPNAAGEQIMLQGVTDCCVIEPDGFSVIDYKTDRVAPGEEAQLAEYYRGQLEAYGMALSRVFSLPVKRRVLYFFATGTTKEV